ncbi:MAG: FtsW/RodA/SpoVE family cell cycle protein [Bacteroidales bacterium]|nr:FtsW/RodA/SpoVE family cell cycle protein [Bacteroidales bacterium]
MAKKERSRFGKLLGLMENVEGDRVIWMIALTLVMLSIIAISSSTSLLALAGKTTREAIIQKHIVVSILGLGAIIGIYNIKSLRVLEIAAKTGFFLSVLLLAYLDLHIKLPGIKAEYINQAWRTINIFGLQLHVFEVVKVAMVMYLAWAVNAYKEDKKGRDVFKLAYKWKDNKVLGWLSTDIGKKCLYIYFPMFLVTIMIIGGSMSSALFIGGVMFVTILIGGIQVKELMPVLLLGVVLIGMCVGIHFLSGGKYFDHVGSAVKRIGLSPEQELVDAVGTSRFEEVLGRTQQPLGAKMAVSEGGLFFGKGPGRSTQKHFVPVIFADYMFAFIIEEYGLVGAILIIILYAALLARGSIVARNCDNGFAKTAIAGLVILISGQALMHMLINVDLGPLTGQTLPMISDGKTSFLCFSIAFGIILSISRGAKRKVEKETAQKAPILQTGDELKESLNDLDLI